VALTITASSLIWRTPALIEPERSREGSVTGPVTIPPGTHPPDILVGHWLLSTDNFPEPQSPLAATVTFTDAGTVTVYLGGCGEVSGRYRVADLSADTRPASRATVADDITGRIDIEITEPSPQCSITVSDRTYRPPNPLDLLRSVRSFSLNPERLSLRGPNGDLLTGFASRLAGEIPEFVRTPPPNVATAGPTTPIPDIMDLPPDQAMDRLLAAGFRATEVTVQIEYGVVNPCDDVPDRIGEPKVIGVTPAVGATLPTGHVVQLFVSGATPVLAIACPNHQSL